MFDRLKRLLNLNDDEAKRGAEKSFEDRQLAAAALMAEAASLDDSYDAAERQRIEQLLQSHFDLSAEEAQALQQEGSKAAADSIEWHGFTAAIKDGFEPEERIALIEMLWEVVYADGEVHDYEASLIRRVTGLLYVSDRDSGEARQRVRARLGID